MTKNISVTRDITEWYTLVGIITNATAWGWITHGILHARYDPTANRTFATVTLSTGQWHGIINDITTIINGYGMVSVDDITNNMARLFNMRDAIEFVLQMGE